MIAFPVMLVEPASQAGIDIPDDLESYDTEKYSRFHLFCCAQLGQPMPNWTCHFDNAKVIARIPEDKIKTIMFNELIEAGFQVGFAIP